MDRPPSRAAPSSWTLWCWPIRWRAWTSPIDYDFTKGQVIIDSLGEKLTGPVSATFSEVDISTITEDDIIGGVTAAGVRLPPDVAEVVSVLRLAMAMWISGNCSLSARRSCGVSGGRPRSRGPRYGCPQPAQGAGRPDDGTGAGGVLRRQPETAEEAEAHKGWAKVLLTDGRTGYVRDVALEPVKYEMTAVFSQREGLAFNDALAETLNTTADKLVPEAVAHWYGGSEDAFRAAVCEQAKKYIGDRVPLGRQVGPGHRLLGPCQQRLYAVWCAHLPRRKDHRGLADA